MFLKIRAGTYGIGLQLIHKVSVVAMGYQQSLWRLCSTRKPGEPQKSLWRLDTPMQQCYASVQAANQEVEG
jgi:hypothetical protein